MKPNFAVGSERGMLLRESCRRTDESAVTKIAKARSLLARLEYVPRSEPIAA